MSDTRDAFGVIRKYQQSAPVDVTAIAEEIGIKVYEAPSLGRNVSGKLTRHERYGGSSGYVILVNHSDAPARKRFTVAHEIAHFILHREQIGEGVEDDAFYRSVKFTSKEEAEANKLAADILMPYELIERLKKEENVKTVRGLAERLEVSTVAMKIRLGLPT